MADFGTAWSCVTGLSLPARLVTGFRVVAEAIARRWGTPHGGLVDDPDYGYDLRQFIQGDIAPTDLKTIARQASLEAQKDERVESCDVTVTYSAATKELSVTGLVTTAQGPFVLVIAIGELTVELLQPEAA